ncbi:hypothetical protein E2562_023086 [Oryza meyeriana var. granulata]|uniref:Uncharacterized protein n=1 Tax=Oryza meyeriana var. granulata TaxID=110450 RepID=A0A6G1EP23_9ORYZ|nr:hypothetical protein E2562_023086 [Oryza meyeriana var. granulata]
MAEERSRNRPRLEPPEVGRRLEPGERRGAATGQGASRQRSAGNGAVQARQGSAKGQRRQGRSCRARRRRRRRAWAAAWLVTASGVVWSLGFLEQSYRIERPNLKPHVRPMY